MEQGFKSRDLNFGSGDKAFGVDSRVVDIFPRESPLKFVTIWVWPCGQQMIDPRQRNMATDFIELATCS